ncbi:MAG: VOC family protein [Phycisphaerales bacterium]|nr:VOC family protein [Phycisphaerales bacterium]
MTTTKSSSGIFDCRPILRVDNVDDSIAYYCDVLGFRIGWRWSDEAQRFLETDETLPAHTALVGEGSAQLILVQCAMGQRGMWLHLDVETAEQVDRLHAQWSQRGARIIEAPSNRPWGMYELRVEDLDQHTFRVAAPARQTGAK